MLRFTSTKVDPFTAMKLCESNSPLRFPTDARMKREPISIPSETLKSLTASKTDRARLESPSPGKYSVTSPDSTRPRKMSAVVVRDNPILRAISAACIAPFVRNTSIALRSFISRRYEGTPGVKVILSLRSKSLPR